MIASILYLSCSAATVATTARPVGGTDVALVALRDAWRRKAASLDELVAAAKTDRVATVMRPYLESLV